MRRLWKALNDRTIPWYAWLVIAVIVLQAVIALSQIDKLRIVRDEAPETVIAVAIYALMIAAVVALARRGRTR